MNTSLFKVFSLTAIITFFSASFVYAQGQTGLRDIQPDTTGEAKINKILQDSGNSFKEGLLNLQDNRRPQAREKFDKSIEVFLMSNVNVRSNAKLQNCYNQLVETIYRIEFPSMQQQPQIKSLTMTCGWDVKSELADNIVKMTQTVQNPTSAVANTAASNEKELIKSAFGNQPDVPQSGFVAQEYVPSPLDELSKLELTPDEVNSSNTPEGQAEIREISYAIERNSLGFRFQMDPRVQQFLSYYQGRGRSTMEIGLARSGMFMRMARRIFRENGVPENIAWLGQVESAWKPVALSWASASGLWQFIPGTGARYGLRRTAYVDERNSFEKATTASAQYLKFLANRYGGNWELAMAAYNSGEGNVDRAIRRAGAANFWAAYPYLPQETRNYVPNILAVILVANNPQKYGFAHVRPYPQLVYDSVRVPSSTSLSLIAQAAGTKVEYLRYLNPEFRTNSTPPEPYVVRVPQGHGNNVYAVLKKVPGSKSNNVALTNVLAGETAQNLANRTGTTVEQIKQANGGIIPTKGPIVIPNSNIRKTASVTPTMQPVAVTSNDVTVIKVKAGDTVAKIASRYGVTAIQLARHNGLTSVDAPLAVGRELRIPPR